MFKYSRQIMLLDGISHFFDAAMVRLNKMALVSNNATEIILLIDQIKSVQDQIVPMQNEIKQIQEHKKLFYSILRHGGMAIGWMGLAYLGVIKSLMSDMNPGHIRFYQTLAYTSLSMFWVEWYYSRKKTQAYCANKYEINEKSNNLDTFMLTIENIYGKIADVEWEHHLSLMR